MRKFLFLALFCLWANLGSVYAADGDFVVVIDAGHGGRDGGANRDKYKEKDINLGVALKLGEMIESNMKDVKVIYTRKGDNFVDLYKRAEIANKAKANLFISIHTNSTDEKNTTASGADTYILGLAKSTENLGVAKRENAVILLEDNHSKRYQNFDPNSTESYIIFEFMTNKYMEQSLQFASYAQAGFSKVAKRVDRGVAQAGFLVLRESSMPSVLIELGFINNATEAKYLASEIGQRSLASSIYAGLEKFKKDFYKKQGQGQGQAYVATKEPEFKPQQKTDTTFNGTSLTSVDVSAKDDGLDDKQGGVKTRQESPFIIKNNDPNKVSTDRVSTQGTNQPERTDRTEMKPVSKPAIQGQQLKRDEPKTVAKETLVPPIPLQLQSTSQPSQVPAGTIEYRVQFLTSEVKLAQNSTRLKGLSPVDAYTDGRSFKYTYGSTTSENESLRLQREVRKKFKDAFVVKFKNNARIK